MAKSQNGYSANDRSKITNRPVPGTKRVIPLRKGDTGYILVHFAAWFDKHIEDIEGGILDDWGYAERPIRGSSTTLSNHASGTAEDLNAPKHPLGKRGTFSKADAALIRKELKATYKGVIRWGGDYKNRADEMHFEIVGSPAAVKALAARLRVKKVIVKVLPAISLARAQNAAKGRKGNETAAKRMQRALRVKGYYKGKIDGAFGPASRKALKHFQKNRKAPQSGVPSKQDLAHLVRGTYRVIA